MKSYTMHKNMSERSLFEKEKILFFPHGSSKYKNGNNREENYFDDPLRKNKKRRAKMLRNCRI